MGIREYHLTSIHLYTGDCRSRCRKAKRIFADCIQSIIMDLDIEINELQGKVLLGDVKIQEKLLHKMERKAELLRKK